jgi:UDP-N-acetylmuramoyl-L-alanyl-D-glutamate--2,6-diaminopimelate ligase
MTPRERISGAAEWREVLGGRMPSGWPKDIRGVTADSRQVRPGWIFVAVKGRDSDGHHFVDDAARRGAAGVVLERPLFHRPAVPAWQVKDSRVALGNLAAAHYGFPSRELHVTGVTGTNGKTSVTFFLRQLLEAASLPCGLIGTVSYAFGQREIPARRTTPGPAELQELLRSMRDAGCGHCAMEVSSHALDQKRADGVEFDTAVFTNLSQDHLDYHGDMESYFAAKCRLFSFPGLKYRLVGDDEWSARLVKAFPDASFLRCGLSADCDVRADILQSDASGSHLALTSPWGEGEVRLGLPGEHNVRNVLQAMAAAVCAGVSWETVLLHAGGLRAAPGRLEPVPSSLGRVLVDYAHTPDALAKVMQTLRPLVSGRLIVVFGCGGDRDRSKRAPMAAEVAKHSDWMILTQDNPRTEDPNRIFADMLAGIPDDRRMNVVPDRAAAVRMGVEALEADDLLLIAGKGHETIQETAGSRVPFDDRDVARACLRERDEALLQSGGANAAV